MRLRIASAKTLVVRDKVIDIPLGCGA